MSLVSYYVGLPRRAQDHIMAHNLNRLCSYTGHLDEAGKQYEFGMYIEKGSDADFLYADTDSIWMEDTQATTDAGHGGEQRIFTHLVCVAGKDRGKKFDWSKEDRLFSLSAYSEKIPVIGNIPRG